MSESNLLIELRNKLAKITPLSASRITVEENMLAADMPYGPDIRVLQNGEDDFDILREESEKEYGVSLNRVMEVLILEAEFNYGDLHFSGDDTTLIWAGNNDRAQWAGGRIPNLNPLVTEKDQAKEQVYAHEFDSENRRVLLIRLDVDGELVYGLFTKRLNENGTVVQSIRYLTEESVKLLTDALEAERHYEPTLASR